jgi:hypothetical protein
MKTIIDKNTGEVLFATVVEVDLQENQMAIEANCELEFNFETQSQYYNLTTNTFEIREKAI